MPHSLILFLLLLFFTTPTPAVSSPLSTIAIFHDSNQTVVCALVLTDNDDRFALNCTTIDGVVRNYPSANSYYYTAIVAGDGFLCGLSNRPSDFNNSTLMWWELEDSSKSTGSRIFNGEPVMKISAEGSHVCGIVGVERRLQCWRWDWEAFSFPNLTNIVDLAVGGGFVCVLDDKGSVRCYGDSDSNSDVSGVVGNEPRGNYSVVAAGDQYACVLSTAGRMNCWGIGAPIIENVDRVYTSLALGENRACGALDDETLSCWGDDGFDLPESLLRMSFLSVVARGRFFCGVMKIDYRLVCWGGEEFPSNHSTVFDKVLPGSCVSTCSGSTTMEGSANLCPSGTAICEVQVPQAPQSSSPPPIIFPPPLTQLPRLQPNSNSSHMKRLIYMVVGAGILGVGMLLLLGFLLFKYFKNKRQRAELHDSEQIDTSRSPSSNKTEFTMIRDVEVETTIDWRLTELISRGHNTVIESFSFRMLEEITDGFSDEKRIGTGGFGSVYRAVLYDGREVAIKRADKNGPGGAATNIRCKEKEKAFLAELALLSRVNHRNLVRLLGFCRKESGPELVLVYDYMTNGTLHDHIHNLRPRSPLSSWRSRIAVALDSARGIEYLHSYSVPAIIHRDIKSSNILLDDSLTAKVSDFGLCLINPENGSVSARILTNAAGTVGYMDPEYYRTRCLTTKSDVYSFGVVLLELLTGCKAVHHHGSGERSFDVDPQNVVDFVVPYIDSNEVPKVLDPRLPSPSPSEIEAVKLFGYLAADCVRLSGHDRPDMKKVVYLLEVVLEMLSG